MLGFVCLPSLKRGLDRQDRAVVAAITVIGRVLFEVHDGGPTVELSVLRCSNRHADMTKINITFAATAM